MRFVTLALIGVFCVLASPSYADTYVDLKCLEKKCEFKKHLKTLQTHEFRGKCGQDEWGYRIPKSQNCKPNTKAVSCTGTKAADIASDYAILYKSCSCTNWDVTTGHNATIVIECGEKASDQDSDAD